MKTDINSASKDDLLKLPGIGKEKAEKIVLLRPWANPQDLKLSLDLSEDDWEELKDLVETKHEDS